MSMLIGSLLRILWAVVWCPLAFGEPQKPLVITFPSVNDPVQRDFDNYYLALLELALNKQNINYQLQPYAISPIAESRSAAAERYDGVANICYSQGRPR